MYSNIWPQASFTPEYSEELLSLIVDLYKDEIRPHINDLKLSKMIDLIDVAQNNLEEYGTGLKDKLHTKSLRNYIIGLFFIYLVIPSSIQFQIKNKNYEIFLDLKSLYEKETNMYNVKIQVVKYISFLNEKQSTRTSLHLRSKRSQTLPSSSFSHDFQEILKLDTHYERLDLPYDFSISSQSSSVSIQSSTSSSTSIVEDLWEPPELQPNDLLQLASDNGSTDLLNEIPNIPNYPAPKPPKLHQARSFPTKTLDPSISNNLINYRQEFEDRTTSFPEDDDLNANLEHFKTSNSHRKDSYHSVYVNEDEEEGKLITIDCRTLYNDLSKGDLSYLLIDIRPIDRFDKRHIPYGNIVNMDPSLVLNNGTFQELEDVLRTVLSKDERQKFKNIRKFDRVVVYSDESTYLKTQSDYLIKFAQLLEANHIKPKTLIGGFDSWKKFLSKNNYKTADLKFVARLPLFTPEPPNTPPPPIPSQQAPTVPGYDFDKFLPRYESTSTLAIDGNSSSALVKSSAPADPPSGPPSGPPPPPPHTIQYQRIQQPLPQHQPYNGYQYQRIAQPVLNNNILPHVNADYSTPYLAQQYPQYSIQRPHSDQSYYSSSHQYPALPLEQPLNHQHQSRPRVQSRSIPIIQKSEHPFVRLSITGLRNLKNTCYINSMIQCLFASTAFRDLFLDNRYENYYNPKFKKSKLAPSLTQLFKKMYLNGGCSIVPSGFLKNCVKLRPDLNIPTEQQDTQEFLMFLLDQLHDELSNSDVVVSDYPKLMEHESLGKEYETWFDGLIKQGFSPISSIFQGQLQDSLTCTNCGFKSSNYSSFYMLSLVIPKLSPHGRKLKKILLEDCIEMFTKDEVLSGENAWDCPKCTKARSEGKKEKDHGDTLTVQDERPSRKHRLPFSSSFKFRGRSSSPAPVKKFKEEKSNGLFLSRSKSHNSNSTIKSFAFVALPPILIIHLSRFLFYDTSQKDTAIVQYPLILEIPHNGKLVKYKLFSLINHNGTLKSGHYTSIANKSLTHDLEHPNWYYFDDEVVKLTEHGSFDGKAQTHMSSSEVYMLFYERIT